MLKISQLTSFTLLHSGSKEELILAQCGPKIQWLADLIAKNFPREKRLGLNFPTGPSLILTWLAALKAGKEPCMLQTPTKKLSKDYWRESISHTIGSCGLEGLIHGSQLLPYEPERLAKSLVIPDQIGESPCFDDSIPEGAVIQLSSGTTGHKKGVRLTSQHLRLHVENYNRSLTLGRDDVIVSWLPLYHDMGFIACFVIPLLLNVPVVMIDPMTWVEQPAKLLDAIEQHRGTVCYMPNFGFEVMARQHAGASIATMRHWISCSEPTYHPTLDQFCRKLGVSSSSVSICYAMAENVFAVTQSSGIKTITLAGKTLVSCGRPIDGVQVKIVENEIFVSSDTSLISYVGSEDVRDAEGFYPTGDLGAIIDGELYISGRKRDVMISAGKKYFLNDLDFALGKIIPHSAGRIASLAVQNKSLGTETALFLVEKLHFWDRNEIPAILEAIRSTVGLEAFELHFVPPHFLTKTSSGKINRKKTLDDWSACQALAVRLAQDESGSTNESGNFLDQVRSIFPSLPESEPLGRVLDSLGAVMMSVICADHQVNYDTQKSLLDLAGQTGWPTGSDDKIFSIIALVDGNKLGLANNPNFFDDDFAAVLAKELGVPVRVEQLCVPPASVLLSDIVFHDYFMPRDTGTKYQPFSSIIQKIKRASMVLIDDEDAFRLRDYCVYPRLSHRFTPDPQADLLAHRLAIYTRNHHQLAREVVPGKDIPLESITESIRHLEGYLGLPVMTLAFHGRFQNYTRNWDYTDYTDYTKDLDCQPIDREKIQTAIHRFIRARKAKMRLQHGRSIETVILSGQRHFCSFLTNREAVDFIADHYESFCIGGLPSSLPYLEKRLKQLNKPYRFSTTLNPGQEDFDCMVLTGLYGLFVCTKPCYGFMHVDENGSGGPRNVSPEMEEACPSLVAGDPSLIEAYVQIYGSLPGGNFVLNLAACIQAAAEQKIPDLLPFWNAYFHVWHRYALGLTYLKNENFGKAEEQLSRCIAIWSPPPSTVRVKSELRWSGPRHALASCLAKIGPSIRADQKFLEALMHTPKPPRNLRFDYALFQSQNRREVDALNAFFTLTSENPLDVEAWCAGGKIALSRPEFNKVAMDWTREALVHHSENEELKCQRARALYPGASIKSSQSNLRPRDFKLGHCPRPAI